MGRALNIPVLVLRDQYLGISTLGLGQGGASSKSFPGNSDAGGRWWPHFEKLLQVLKQ